MARKSQKIAARREAAKPCPPSSPKLPNTPPRRWIAAVCLLLLLATFAVFGRTVNYGFVNCDDPDYISENRPVRDGLTPGDIGWAFTSSHSANWHPLTWISHMADCSLYGLDHPGGHHITNVLLHAAAAVLLFLALLKLTGGLWPSAFVAAIFAIHPLRVESVAWIAERKDVLSGVFFMLTLLAYAGYAMRPFSWWRYLSVIVFFALGLMAKPMLVTLPCVLLLLDYWPLKRLRRQAPDMGKQATTVSPRGQNVTVTGPTRQATIFNWRVLWEKLPLLALTAISCRLTVWAQANVDAFKELALQWRAGNAAVSTVVYLGQLFYPANLAAFYPHPASRLPEWQIVAALATLAAISAAIAILARKRGYLVVGWLWYLGMLAPVCGLLQVGTQGHADRYTYLPQIGLCIAIAWAVAELTKNWCWQKLICGSASAIVIAALMWCAWRQTGYWRDSETLWRHAIDCIPSDFAYNNLGAVLGEAGKTDEAIECYKRAIAINPRHAKAHNNLGLYYYKHGKLDEAVEHYRLAVANERLYAEAYNNLGAALYGQGKTQEAIEQFQLALEIDPEQYMALHNLGAMRAAQGKVEEAIGLYLQALQSKPRYFDCYRDLAVAYARIGKFPEAVSAAEKALALADASQAPAIRAQLEFYRAGKSPR